MKQIIKPVGFSAVAMLMAFALAIVFAPMLYTAIEAVILILQTKMRW